MARLSRYWNLHSGARLAARHRTLEALARRHRELRETPPPAESYPSVTAVLNTLARPAVLQWAASEPAPEPPVPEMDWRRPCHGCGQLTEYVYCNACSDQGLARCPHGNDPTSCDACDVAGDLAYDAWRESR